MKKYYFALVLILLISPIMAQNTPSYVPKDGLIGWWPFNGNANDESGKGNNGKVTAASLTLDRKGSANSAYSFNENGSFIEVSSLINTDMCLNSFSFSMWVLRDRLTANQYYSESLISKGENKLVISYDVGRTGQPDLNYNGFGFDTYGKNYGVYNGILPINKWAHIVCVKTANEFYYYIDNKKYVVPFNIDNQSVSDLKSTLFFGGGNYGGKLDDIAYYNRAITESEIQALYEGNSCPIIASISPQGFVNICEGSSIKMSANTGKNYTYQWVKDKIAIKGATTSAYEATKAGKYIVFVNDGACTDSSDVVIIDTIPLPTAPVINNNYLQVCVMMPREEVARKFQINLNYRWYRSETGNDSLQKYEPLMPGKWQYYLSQFSATNPACESKKRTRIQVEMLESPKINYPGTTTFCQGDSLKLETYLNGNQWDYVWMKDYNWIQGTDGKSSIIVKETGNYSLTNKMCMNQGGGMNNIYITFNPSPDAKITYTGSTILPTGGSLNLMVTDKAGNKYEWYKNGTLIQGATTNSYLAKEVGKYSVKVTNGTCSASSIPVDITGNTDPKPILINTGKKSFCFGDSTTLKVDAVNAVFEWLKDGKTITGAVGSSFVVKQTGIYSVKVTRNSIAQTTDTLRITVFDNPNVDIKDITTNIQQQLPVYVFKNQKPLQL